MQLNKLMIYSGASTGTLVSTLAFYGIFVAKEMENNSLILDKLIFEGSINKKYIGGYGLKRADYNRILKNLEAVNGLKDESDFLTKKGQNDLRKSLKYTILMKLCNTNYFGTKATQLIGGELCQSDKEFVNCVGKGDYFFIPRLSESQPNLLSIGYARFVKKYLDKTIFNEVLEEVRKACEKVRPDFIDTDYFNGNIEDIMDSCDRFINLFKETKNLFSLYPLIDTENEICKHIWFLDQE